MNKGFFSLLLALIGVTLLSVASLSAFSPSHQSFDPATASLNTNQLYVFLLADRNVHAELIARSGSSCSSSYPLTINPNVSELDGDLSCTFDPIVLTNGSPVELSYVCQSKIHHYQFEGTIKQQYSWVDGVPSGCVFTDQYYN